MNHPTRGRDRASALATSFRRILIACSVLFTLLFASACTDTMLDDPGDGSAEMLAVDGFGPSRSLQSLNTTNLYKSDGTVDTWNAIPVANDPNWPTTVCTTQPPVGLNANWTNPHKAFVANGAAFQSWYGSSIPADWINAWPSFEGSALTTEYGGPHLDNTRQNWTRYQTPVTGTGEFVLNLVADNCSWIYLSEPDGSNPQLVGVQLTQNLQTNPIQITYPVTLSGDALLDFIVFDGGGQAGGMFSLQTNTGTTFTDTDGDGLPDVTENNIHNTDPNNPDTDGDGLSDGDEVNVSNTDPNNPDTDGDGIPDGSDPDPLIAGPADSDGDGVNDASDPFPNSDTSPTVIVNGNDTGVGNQSLGDGSTFNDRIGECGTDAKNHGQYVRCVVERTDAWRRAGLISGREAGAIRSAAARKD